MRKSNSIVLIIAALVSAGLLFTWFALGFNRADAPLDPVISVIWWLVIAAVIVAAVISESKRRERMRTCFVYGDVLYNAEPGFVSYGGKSASESVASVLGSLNYDYKSTRAPKPVGDDVRYIVRTKKFSDSGRIWEGEVVSARPQAQPREFHGMRELKSIIG